MIQQQASKVLLLILLLSRDLPQAFMHCASEMAIILLLTRNAILLYPLVPWLEVQADRFLKADMSAGSRQPPRSWEGRLQKPRQELYKTS